MYLLLIILTKPKKYNKIAQKKTSILSKIIYKIYCNNINIYSDYLNLIFSKEKAT